MISVLKENNLLGGSKLRRKGKMIWILLGLVLCLLIIMMVRCTSWINKAEERLETFQDKVQTIDTSYGKMSYIDEGSGEVILIIHGLFGGYDQGYDSMKELVNTYRIIAPSRFGYVGSDLPEHATVTDQVNALKELLDELNIDKAYVVGTSAGGLCALKFGILYPERVKGVGLYCSGAVPLTKPTGDEMVKYASIPKTLCNDFALWAMGPIMKKAMSMTDDVWLSVFPVSARAKGVINDGYEVNIDSEKHFDDYTLEELKVPVLILHAKDDKMASYEKVEKMTSRIPNVNLVSFETGGHMMTGNDEAVEKAMIDFIEMNK